MRARINGAKLTEEIMGISSEVDALETIFKYEKKACFEEVFTKYNVGIDESGDSNTTNIQQKIINKIRQNIENNMNHLIQKQIILNKIYMAKSKARFSEINQVLQMQREAKARLIELRGAIENELEQIRLNRKKLQTLK